MGLTFGWYLYDVIAVLLFICDWCGYWLLSCLLILLTVVWFVLFNCLGLIYSGLFCIDVCL